MSSRVSRGRRMLGRIRRGRFAGEESSRSRAAHAEAVRELNEDPLPPAPIVSDNVGWDHNARPEPEPASRGDELPLRPRILSLFSDPRTDMLTASGAAKVLGRPQQDVETTLDMMVHSGELVATGSVARKYRVAPQQKARLEAMFRLTAQELGEHGVLARTQAEDALATLEDEAEEPRLPVTAGLLSLFLPGTGQLLNGDVGRASLVFAVWSLAWITHLSPVWTFVCLYAGAEAFFTAKIRSMERKMAKEHSPTSGPRGELPPPKPTSP